MGLIRITANDGLLPENAGDKELFNGTYNIRTSVNGGVVSIQIPAVDVLQDTITVTYTATAPATIPSDEDIYGI